MKQWRICSKTLAIVGRFAIGLCSSTKVLLEVEVLGMGMTRKVFHCSGFTLVWRARLKTWHRGIAKVLLHPLRINAGMLSGPTEQQGLSLLTPVITSDGVKKGREILFPVPSVFVCLSCNQSGTLEPSWRWSQPLSFKKTKPTNSILYHRIKMVIILLLKLKALFYFFSFRDAFRGSNLS